MVVLSLKVQYCKEGGCTVADSTVIIGAVSEKALHYCVC
jgi:hypothetical protein